MSWLRSAVIKAVEVGGSGKDNLTRTVRNVADSVVQTAGTAVFEGAKLLQDRIGARNCRSFKQAVKQLEEVSVSCTGIERVQLLRRWLLALKETVRLFEGSTDHSAEGSAQLHYELMDSPRKPTVELYFDRDKGGEPMNFLDVFLHSQALEGMTLSMILEAPNEEEVSLLLEIFGISLVGGKEVHQAIVCSIQDLAKDFSNYEVEILARKEELLQYAQGAIAGLKVNTDIKRIDSEVSNIHQNLDGMKRQQPSSEGDEKSSQATSAPTAEDLKQSIAQIQLCSRLEALLLKKKFLNNGDSPEVHAQKVDKLKILSESLNSSVSRAEDRIFDHRIQKDEALSFRVSKTSEVSQLEKELEAEVRSLENRREEVEAELKKVTNMLAGANARLRNAREERQHFDEASNQILEHFKTKGDELARSASLYRAEADACNAFIVFLDATWGFHSSYTEQKEKHIRDELARHEEYFVNLAVRLLSAYKDELAPILTRIGKLVDKITGSEIATFMDEGKSQAVNARKYLEEEYLDSEAKIITMFSIVENIRKQFIVQNMESCRKGNERIKELCDLLGKMKDEFDSIERPTLEIETPTFRAETSRISLSPLKKAPQDKSENSEGQILRNKSPRQVALPRLNSIKGVIKSLNPQTELSKFSLALEEDSREGSMEDIDWEFDEPQHQDKPTFSSTK